MLFQIQALIDMPSIGVKKGDLGGFIGSDECLSHAGNCWVFEESTVALGCIVIQNAQVKGRSHVSGKSRLGGNCVIENSDIKNGSFVRAESLVKGSTLNKSGISERTEIINSRLTQIRIMSGKVNNSRLQSVSSESLVFHNDAQIDDCDMDFYDEKPYVFSSIQMKKVYATGLNVFQIAETTILTNVSFVGDSELSIGTPLSADKNICYLIGKEELVEVNSGQLTMVNSTIKGQITVSGIVQMENSELFGHATILNHTPECVSLVNTKVLECASIHKSSGMKSSTFENQLISGDTRVVC